VADSTEPPRESPNLPASQGLLFEKDTKKTAKGNESVLLVTGKSITKNCQCNAYQFSWLVSSLYVPKMQFVLLNERDHTRGTKQISGQKGIMKEHESSEKLLEKEHESTILLPRRKSSTWCRFPLVAFDTR